jgi:diketogulonate reductase-like aldo/keto reductase
MEVLLNSGHRMPVLAFGTAKIEENDIKDSIKNAIFTGFRHFDTASVYENEGQVGIALEEIFTSGYIVREEIFITTKIWPSDYRRIKIACFESLQRLKCNYVDLLLLHWPIVLKQDYKSLSPVKKLDLLDRFPLHQVWSQMEELLDCGMVHSIGLSNWTISLLQDLLSYCRVPPAVNQVEVNPFHQQPELLSFCLKNSIFILAYRVIFSPPAHWTGFNESILKIPEILSISTKNSMSPAQVCIIWCMQLGCGVVVKSSKLERILENFESLGKKLGDEDMKVISGIEQKGFFTDLFFSFGVHIFK